MRVDSIMGMELPCMSDRQLKMMTKEVFGTAKPVFYSKCNSINGSAIT